MNTSRLRLLAAALFLVSVPSLSHAYVMPAGSLGARVDFGYNTASSMWMGTELVPYLANGRVNVVTSGATVSYGFNPGLELDVRAAYAASKMSEGMMGGRIAGDSVSGLSEIGARVTKEVISPSAGSSWWLNGFMGIRMPGTRGGEGDDFIAINDGATKFDLGLSDGRDFGQFGLNAQLMLSLRTASLAPQLSLNVSAPIDLLGMLQLGPMVSYFHTLSGTTFADPAFDMKFSHVKETHLGLGVFAAKAITDRISADAFVHFKVSGADTDKGTSTGFGLNYLF